MLKQILKQIWKQRRANGWILLELLIVSIIIWFIIDPIFITLSNRSIPSGFDYDDVYIVNLGEIPANSPKYNPVESDSVNSVTNFYRMWERIRQYQDVEAVAVSLRHSYPYGGYYSGNSYRSDTLYYPVQTIRFMPDEYFRVMRHKDAHGEDWKSLEELELFDNSVFITKDVENYFFKGKSGVGKMLLSYDSTSTFRIAGVFDYIKMDKSEQPSKLVFRTIQKIEKSNLPDDVTFLIRVKEGMPEKQFIEDFRKNLVGKLQVGNYFLKSIVSGNKLERDYEYTRGTTNKLRTQTGLAVFFLINIMLGVGGTFWLRSESRRGEIGVRMACGSNRNQLKWQFIAEGWLMATLAAVIGFFIVLQYIYQAGIDIPGKNDYADAYLVNNLPLHFLLICGITYLLILTMVFIGVWFPARAASKTDVVDAIRDE